MIKVDQIERIRKLVLVEGLSQRAAAKAAGVSRHAVRVALLEPVERKYTLKEPKKRPKASVVEGLIETILKQDLTAPPKQRHTARRIYHRLVEEHQFTGSEATVRRIVAAHKQRAREVFVPLEYEPGAEAQVDFGEAEILLSGVPTKVHLFCMKLAFSRMPFVMAFPSQKQEAFFEGHVEAFAFFGGVPRRLTYDNLKAAVQTILEGHNRKEQEAFTLLRAHYLFDSHFCTPRRGNEKGQVESLVGYVRRNALVPRPEVSSLVPPAYQTFYESLRRHDPLTADRQFVQVLLLHRKHGLDLLHQAVAEAVERQNCTLETVRLLLQMQAGSDAPPVLTPETRSRFPAVDLPPVSAAAYGRLQQRRGEVH
jgi:transposase